MAASATAARKKVTATKRRADRRLRRRTAGSGARGRRPAPRRGRCAMPTSTGAMPWRITMPQQGAPAGAERHADAQLTGPLHHAVGDHAVDPDRREHQRGQREAAEHAPRSPAAARARRPSAPPACAMSASGRSGIELGERRAGSPAPARAGRPRLRTASTIERDRRLGEREIDLRIRLLAEPLVAHVAHDADDRSASGLRGRRGPPA